MKWDFRRFDDASKAGCCEAGTTRAKMQAEGATVVTKRQYHILKTYRVFHFRALGQISDQSGEHASTDKPTLYRV